MHVLCEMPVCKIFVGYIALYGGKKRNGDVDVTQKLSLVDAYKESRVELPLKLFVPEQHGYVVTHIKQGNNYYTPLKMTLYNFI